MSKIHSYTFLRYNVVKPGICYDDVCLSGHMSFCLSLCLSQRNGSRNQNVFCFIIHKNWNHSRWPGI